MQVRKLATANSEDIIYNPIHCYRIIEFLTVFGTLSEILILENASKMLNLKKQEIRASVLNLL